ncbi:MAG TPA: phosphopantetheine-binding protein, partial [Thermoanaerobaculia bacterium]
VEDNFFDVGGHSLHLMRLQDRLSARWGEVPIVELFRHPTIRSLASYLASLQPAATRTGRLDQATAGAAKQRGKTRGEERRAAIMQRTRSLADAGSGQGVD